jgi:hypothetical protein
MAFGKLSCMLCGKERLDPDAPSSQEFYLCSDCSTFWLRDYLRRLKARILSVLPWKRG